MIITTNKRFYLPAGSHRVGGLNKGVKRSTSPEAIRQRKNRRTYSRGTQSKYCNENNGVRPTHLTKLQ